MKFGLKSAIAVVTLIAVGGYAFAQSSIIVQRQDKMKAIGASVYGVVGRMARGSVPYDGARAKAALEEALRFSVGYDEMFPKGSETGDKTKAAARIWEDPEGFKAAYADLKKVLAAETENVTKDLDTLRVSMRSIAAACEACHADGKYLVNTN